MEKLKKNEPAYNLTLYVAGNEPNSALAKSIVEEVCVSYLTDNFNLKIVDVIEKFNEAIKNKIIVVPTLLVQSTKMNIKVVGSLDNVASLVKVLGLKYKT
jgi:circadian clock protein KaiB